MPSVKIPQAFYEQLKDLKSQVWLKTRTHISFLELMTEILEKADWKALKAHFLERPEP